LVWQPLIQQLQSNIDEPSCPWNTSFAILPRFVFSFRPSITLCFAQINIFLGSQSSVPDVKLKINITAIKSSTPAPKPDIQN